MPDKNHHVIHAGASSRVEVRLFPPHALATLMLVDGEERLSVALDEGETRDLLRALLAGFPDLREELKEPPLNPAEFFSPVPAGYDTILGHCACQARLHAKLRELTRDGPTFS